MTQNARWNHFATHALHMLFCSEDGFLHSTCSVYMHLHKMFIRKHKKTVVGSSVEDTCVPMHLWSLAPRLAKKQAKDLDARYLLYGATSIFQWKLLPFTSRLGLNATMSMISKSPDIFVYTSDISSSIFHWIVLFLLPKHKAFLLCTCVADRHAMILLFGSH